MGFLRKLTANYSEDEYQAYLMSEPDIDTSKSGWHHNYAEIKHPDGSHKYILAASHNVVVEVGKEKKIYHPQYKLTENLIKSGFHRMKDFVCVLTEISWHTDYDVEYLLDVYNGMDEDEDWVENLIFVCDSAIEGDL